MPRVKGGISMAKWKDNWSRMSQMERIEASLLLLVSIGAIVFSLLSVLGIWDKAGNVYIPLLGILMLLQSHREWKQHRGVAIFSLMSGIFILICWVVVMFLL